MAINFSSFSKIGPKVPSRFSDRSTWSIVCLFLTLSSSILFLHGCAATRDFLATLPLPGRGLDRIEENYFLVDDEDDVIGSLAVIRLKSGDTLPDIARHFSLGINTVSAANPGVDVWVLIHTYSLVHDDLPAMDDDDLRRGMPTCHIAYDEATAVLVGDALQARAFELLTEAPGCAPVVRLQMVQCLAAASGARGMVGGQAIDIAASQNHISAAHLQAMHALKTGALIQASISLGALAAGASNAQLARLDAFGQIIGLAFQVQDDVLDVASDSATLGKNQGSDAAANKPTYVSQLGLEGARNKVTELLAAASKELQSFGETGSGLLEIADYICRRDH